MSRPPAAEEPQGPSGHRPWWRLVRLVSGWLLVALGLVGLALPVLQGVALILAGLALLAPDVPFARRWLDWLKKRMRKLRSHEPNEDEP